MSKSYWMYRSDLADTAAVEAAITANPPAYTVGTVVVAAVNEISRQPLSEVGVNGQNILI
jgi:hypothetical protein